MIDVLADLVDACRRDRQAGPFVVLLLALWLGAGLPWLALGLGLAVFLGPAVVELPYALAAARPAPWEVAAPCG